MVKNFTLWTLIFFLVHWRILSLSDEGWKEEGKTGAPEVEKDGEELKLRNRKKKAIRSVGEGEKEEWFW